MRPTKTLEYLRLDRLGLLKNCPSNQNLNCFRHSHTPVITHRYGTHFTDVFSMLLQYFPVLYFLAVFSQEAFRKFIINMLKCIFNYLQDSFSPHLFPPYFPHISPQRPAAVLKNCCGHWGHLTLAKPMCGCLDAGVRGVFRMVAIWLSWLSCKTTIFFWIVKNGS